MSSDSSTAFKQQLYETVLALASDEGNVEERLSRAYYQHMQKIDSSSLPPEVRGEYEAIVAELARAFSGPGKIDGVDRSTAVNLAMRIILIYDSMIK